MADKTDKGKSEDRGAGGAGGAGGAPRLGARKLYLVEVVQHIPDAPAEYRDLYERYWSAVDDNLVRIEQTSGVIKHVFGEGVVGRGEDARVGLERANPGAWRVVKERLDGGAKFELYEDDELLAQVMDWSRCLGLGMYSSKVANEVTERYRAVIAERNRFQAKRLDEAVGEGAAALVLGGVNELELPGSFERIVVAPPERDAVDRWLKQAREQLMRQAQAAQQQQRSPDGGASGGGAGGDGDGAAGGGSIWTPG